MRGFRGSREILAAAAYPAGRTPRARAVLPRGIGSWQSTSSLPLLLRPENQSKPGNLILAALAADDYEQLRSLLEVHPLRMRETLQEAGDRAEYVYFPTSGIISVLTVLENGMMIEFATVGREGTTGVPLFLGLTDSNMALVSQVPGEALRMRGEDFLIQIARSPSLALILNRYRCGPGSAPPCGQTCQGKALQNETRRVIWRRRSRRHCISNEPMPAVNYELRRLPCRSASM